MREFWNRETALWAILAVAVALTAVAGSYNVRRMVASEEVLQTTRATHAELAALLADVIDAETGHRGYVLTGRDEYLEPFWEADARVWDRLAALRERVAEHPRQGERLAAAEQLVREKFAEMRRTIGLRDTAGRDAAVAGVAEGQGKRTMDGIRVVLREMLEAEDGRLKERAAAADAQYHTAEFANVLAAVLSVCILTGVAVLTRRERQRCERLAAKLAASKVETDAALGRLDAFLGHAPYGIAYFDPDLRFVRVNDTFARTHGVPIREHLGRPLTDVLPQFPPDLLADYQRVLDTGDGLAHRLVRGPEIIWEVTAFAVPDAGGRRGLGVIGLNVTERQRADEQLRLSEARFRELADAMPQIVYATDPDGRVAFINRRWIEYTGQADAQAADLTPLVPPDELGDMLGRWARATAAGTPFEAEFRLLGQGDVGYRWFLTRAVPVRDADGRVVRWYGTSTDIHEQKRNEQALRASEAYVRGVLDNSPDCIKVLDPAGTVLEINGPGLTAFGVDDVAVVRGRLWADLWPADRREGLRAAVAAAAAGRVERFSGWSPTAAGEMKFWDVIVAPVLGPDGRPVRLVGVSRDATAQKRFEDELNEAKRFNEAVLHSLPTHLAVIEADGTIVGVNESWRQFGRANGVPPDYRWEGANYFAACRGDELGEQAVAGIRAVAGGEREAFAMEYPCHGGGQERYFVLRVNRFRGDGPGRLVVTHENISDRVRAEREVRDAASQLRQLTDGMPLLMWACRPTGECDYVSRQWTDYTGAALDDQLGYGWLEALHPDDRAGTAEAWQHAVRASGEYDIAFRLRRHDGEYRWFAVRGIPLRDPDGRIVRWFGSCTDIDDRKRQATTLEQMVTERTATLHRTNASLREQQIFLDAILNSVAEGIVACDGDGRLKLFNAATRRMHGLPAESVALDQWAEHYRLYEADGVTPMPADRVPLARAWAGEEVRDAEMMLRTADGADRYVLVSGVQLRAADGGQFGAVVSMRDVTERREHERQLVVTAAALKASNEELEKFAYIASHDLQEPLRKIQAFGTRLAGKHRDALGDQGKDYIDRMLDSAGRMRKLIEDLLAFSRVATKTVPFEPVDLAAVVRDVLRDLEVRVQQSGGRVEVGPLPLLRGDASQLRQVFQNLIGNALKFARPGVPPVVRVTAVPFRQIPPDADPAPPDGDGWRIAVADNGIGFEQGYAERIFELFQRLHARVQYEGTGLGLAIVRKIILRYGATIAARGTPNEGAAFLIDWPLRALPPT